VSLGLIGARTGKGREGEGGWGPMMVISDYLGVWGGGGKQMRGAWRVQVEVLPWRFREKEGFVR